MRIRDTRETSSLLPRGPPTDPSTSPRVLRLWGLPGTSEPLRTLGSDLLTQGRSRVSSAYRRSGSGQNSTGVSLRREETPNLVRDLRDRVGPLLSRGDRGTAPLCFMETCIGKKQETTTAVYPVRVPLHHSTVFKQNLSQTSKRQGKGGPQWRTTDWGRTRRPTLYPKLGQYWVSLCFPPCSPKYLSDLYFTSKRNEYFGPSGMSIRVSLEH